MLLEEMRDVCIQDPRHETAYFIPGSRIAQFRCDALSSEQQCSVRFTVSDNELLDEVPVSLPIVDSEPNVVLRNSDTGGLFFLSYENLQQFRIDRPDVHPTAKMFTLPMPEALVEEMPAAIRALLQTMFTDEQGASVPS